MQTFNIYEEIQPTYGEWLPILTELGYSIKVEDIKHPIFKQHTKQYRLDNPAHKSFIILPYLPDDAPVLKGIFASYSIQLYWQGIIDDEQDMAKMIEKNRLAIASAQN